MYNGRATVQNSKAFLKMLNKVSLSEPTIPLLGIAPKRMENRDLNVYMYAVFITALFTIAKICKQPKWSSKNE